jgi:Holliday junction resolvase
MEYLNKMKIGSFERVSNLPAYDKRINSYRRPSKYSKKGMCDIIGCLDGRFIGIEVKTRREFEWVLRFWIRVKRSDSIDKFKPTNKKEDHVLNQIKYIADKNSNGAFCFFTYSLEHTLKKLGEIT